MTVSVVQPVRLKRTIRSLLPFVVQKSRKVMLRPSVRSRDYSAEEVAHIIKKCNDFGAGGVSVAIGELADGLRINLDKVPKKYAGLDGTELQSPSPRSVWQLLVS